MKNSAGTRLVRKSMWIFHFNSGGCNGCDIELFATLTPLYDAERLGVQLAPSPKHADVLVVTGPVTCQTARALKEIYEQMPEPKIVIALGTCAVSGGIFEGGYNVIGGASKVVPVDVEIPGCPPSPASIMEVLYKIYRGEILGRRLDGQDNDKREGSS
ncbi:NADH-quinone oxidoreductase subunit B family protein [Thermogladius sp. 4427co]|uniref:NADH-quinone oxidoreductase subunit B family protein n=1 Tax=Thermogladius sp. 4427co TaxID=3450718 RepID=UPI003F78F73A